MCSPDLYLSADVRDTAQELVLAFNKIGGPGMIAFSEPISKAVLPSLRVLELDYNRNPLKSTESAEYTLLVFEKKNDSMGINYVLFVSKLSKIPSHI